MRDKSLPNECKNRLQDDSAENLNNSEPISLLHTDVFESFQSGFQQIHDKVMLEYTSQNTSRKDSDTIEDSFLETQEFDTSRFQNFFQYQYQYHGVSKEVSIVNRGTTEYASCRPRPPWDRLGPTNLEGNPRPHHRITLHLRNILILERTNARKDLYQEYFDRSSFTS
ncbi:hypothetical protein TNCV_3277911 [Trichonephila clavipes]|nr:hypothetical protein TNCV_3277911 [Trichonephila clavipes]